MYDSFTDDASQNLSKEAKQNKTKPHKPKTKDWHFPKVSLLRVRLSAPCWVTWGPSTAYLTSAIKIGLSKWADFIMVLCSNRRFGINVIFFLHYHAEFGT